MTPNPDSFLSHFRQHGYHPRSDKHSNALAEAIAADLLRHCPAISRKAKAGQIVFDLNFTLKAGTADWNIDLVLGAPSFDVEPPVEGIAISRTPPSRVEIAIEIKSVMTEHRKAVKNRKRDLEAHHEHVHNYSEFCIAGGVLAINGSATFQSPLRNEPTIHRDPDRLVQHCLQEFRSVAARGGPTGYGLEARCAIVVDMDNVNQTQAAYITRPPAPQVGDPLHYDTFIRTVCDFYTRRFADSS